MILAIDIGNTHTVLGIFKNRTLVAESRIPTSTIRTDDELWITLKPALDSASAGRGSITGSVISSVVPNVTPLFEMMVSKYLSLHSLIISATLDTGMPVKYEDPKAVGADRICNAVAAFAKYGGPCIAVDFGTATTFDVVSKKGEYLGGVIAPGVETSAIDLQRRAALLPKVELQFPDKVIGTNTTASMQSGILYGAVDAMEGMIRRLKATLGDPATVVATGGFSKLIASKSKLIDHVEPTLVLEGAVMIYERLKKV